MDKQTSVTKYDRTESMVYPVFIRLQPLRPCDHAIDMKFFRSYMAILTRLDTNTSIVIVTSFAHLLCIPSDDIG